jgi:hypothetical protein
MGLNYFCIECLEDHPYLIRAFKSNQGKRGHEKRSGHKTLALPKAYREGLVGFTREEASELLTESIDDLLVS